MRSHFLAEPYPDGVCLGCLGVGQQEVGPLMFILHRPVKPTLDRDPLCVDSKQVRSAALESTVRGERETAPNHFHPDKVGDTVHRP